VSAIVAPFKQNQTSWGQTNCAGGTIVSRRFGAEQRSDLLILCFFDQLESSLTHER